MAPRLTDLRSLASAFTPIGDHPKFKKAGPGPSWLWFTAFAKIQDGFISDTVIDHLGVRFARRMADHLVAAGLWERIDGGWQMIELDTVVVRPHVVPDAKPTPTAADIVLIFPTSGLKKQWALTAEQVAQWKPLYPTLDVVAECRKALAWAQANGLKTAAGMAKFLVFWLNRASDRYRPAGGPSSPVRGRTGAAPPGKYEHH